MGVKGSSTIPLIGLIEILTSSILPMKFSVKLAADILL